MKVLINRQPLRDRSWGGGNQFVIACHDLLPQFGYVPVHSLSDAPDVILMIDPRSGTLMSGEPGINQISGYKSVRKDRVAVVHRINECDARKGTTDVDAMLLSAQREVDERVFVSNWLSEHLRERWGKIHPSAEYGAEAIHGGMSGNPVIHNGVDMSLFRPRTTPAGKIRIVTHHWSDNPLKGLDVTVWLDDYFIPKYGDRFEYTYIGRLKVGLKNSKMIPACHGEALAGALAENDIYVSGSRFDPGPNHVLEALSCGLITYVHADGGGAVEFAGGSHNTYSNAEELEAKLLSAETGLIQATSYMPQSWEKCIEQYAKLFDELTSHMP